AALRSRRRAAGPGAVRRPGARLPRLELELAHRPPARSRLPGKRPACGMVLGGQQRAAVTLGQLAALEQLERLVGKIEQADQVRDRDPAASDAQADLLAREPQLLDERRAGARLLDRVEVLPHHVLHQRHLERRGIVVMAHDRGYALEFGELRGAPAALA